MQGCNYVDCPLAAGRSAAGGCKFGTEVMRYWLEYWCPSRSAWLEVTDRFGRPSASDHLGMICTMAAALSICDALPRRVVDLHGRVVAYYG